MRASCLCGSIQLNLLELPKHFYQCHCSLCRKQSGTASNAATIVRSDRIVWLEGEALVTRYQKATGFSSHFCRQCGSPVPNRLGNGKFSWFPLGLLDEHATIALTLHLHVGSSANWEVTPSLGTRYQDMPSIQIILQALHG